MARRLDLPAGDLPAVTATLRAFRPDELEVVWEARRRRASPTAPVTPGTRRALERQIERSGRLHDGFLRLAIDVEGRLVGEGDARCPATGVPPGVFELGLDVYGAADRGGSGGAE